MLGWSWPGFPALHTCHEHCLPNQNVETAPAGQTYFMLLDTNQKPTERLQRYGDFIWFTVINTAKQLMAKTCPKNMQMVNVPGECNCIGVAPCKGRVPVNLGIQPKGGGMSTDRRTTDSWAASQQVCPCGTPPTCQQVNWETDIRVCLNVCIHVVHVVGCCVVLICVMWCCVMLCQICDVICMFWMLIM